MVKLDVTMLRYLGKDEMRILSAVEQLMKNHEFAPKAMIPRIAKMKPSAAFRAIGECHKHKLLYHDRKKYDGYKLTFAGYDYLALKAMSNKQLVAGVGLQFGCGKESDIWSAVTPDDEEICMKLHRLGRTSFRTVKNNRDYLQHRKHASWMYLSRLSALKEYAFMKVLYDQGFPCPRPIHVNRHIVLMERLEATPLSSVRKIENPDKVYARCMELIVRLAGHGLIHCDFNEFNLMLDDDETIWVIDFPQVVSIDHLNAEEYFDRDVQCIRDYFARKHRFIGESWPTFDKDVAGEDVRLDKSTKASGYEKAKKLRKQLAGDLSDDDDNAPAEDVENSAELSSDVDSDISSCDDN